MKWQVGITTVPSRRDDLLPRTLTSLNAAGFDVNRLFVDDCRQGDGSWTELGPDITCRWPSAGIVLNWWLGLVELYGRDPHADRYAMFQDDFVTCKDVLPYLEQLPMAKRMWWNLFCFQHHESAYANKPHGFHEGPLIGGANTKKLQRGMGAVALIFSNECVRALLSSNGLVEKVRTADPLKATRNLDGCIVNTLNALGWREMVHWPSLIRHTGLTSTMDRPGHGHVFPFQPETSFPGENHSALDFLASPSPVPA